MGATLTASLLLAASSAAGDSPWLQLVDSVSCPSPAQIKATLGDRSIGVSADSYADVVMEVVSTGGPHLVVRLTKRSLHLTTETTVDIPGSSCLELAHTVALLAESWFLDLPTDDRSASPRMASRASTPTPPADPSPSHPEVAQDLPSPALGRHAPRVSLSAAMELVASGAVGLGGDLSAEVALSESWSVGMRFSLLPSLSAQDGQGGTVSVQRQEGTLFLAATILGSSSDRSPSLDALAGALLLHVSAQGQGFPQSSNPSRWQPGAVAGLRGNQPLSGPLFGYLEVDGQVVPDAIQFQVADNGGLPTTLVTEPAWWLCVSLGVGARFL